MNTISLTVNILGLAAIGWIIWYFWFWHSKPIDTKTSIEGIQEVDVIVKGGYQPSTIVAKTGQLIRLNFTRNEATTCGEEVLLPDFGKRAYLPENKTITIEVLPVNPGQYEITCGMHMYQGKLLVR